MIYIEKVIRKKKKDFEEAVFTLNLKDKENSIKNMTSKINNRYESPNGEKKVGDLRNRNKTNGVSKEEKGRRWI